MTLLFISFVAGVLTVLAPCILPLLPVVIGSAASGRSKATPYIVIASLSVSIILFTYLIKVSTAFIAIPTSFWALLSGGILMLFGLTLLFPVLWASLPGVRTLSANSNKLLGSGHQKKSFWGDVLVGAALGPVFSSCSPTYFVILGTVLPASFALGTVYLLVYVAGLALVLILIALLGEKFLGQIQGLSDPNSSFKRWVGGIFVAVGILILFGLDKQLEIFILDSGWSGITTIETTLLQQVE